MTVNLKQLNTKFQDGDTVDLDTLQEKKLLNLSGREAKLPLKVRHAAHRMQSLLMAVPCCQMAVNFHNSKATSGIPSHRFAHSIG